MQGYYDIVVNSGNDPVVGASVFVYDSTGALATIFQSDAPISEIVKTSNGTPYYLNQELVSPQSNPITTDSEGRYVFFADNGVYTVVITANGYNSKTLTVTLFDATTQPNPVYAIAAGPPNTAVNVSAIGANVATTNGDIALVPKGTGAILGQVPTATVAGGDKRGTYAVDWQTHRTSANQVASGSYATISGGYRNRASGTRATVGGGTINIATGTDAVVAGGNGGQATGEKSFVGGGFSNAATAIGAVACGGELAVASGQYSVVGGGSNSTASANFAFAGGGYAASASGLYSVSVGGYANLASADYSAIMGGASNAASATHTTIGGGDSNAASALYAVVGGGQSNTSSGLWATIGGGVTNTASNSFATIAGGASNQATSTSATVGGGSGNVASGASATISGGSTNTANSSYSYVSGGAYGNTRGIVGYHAFPACNAPVWDDTGKSQKGLLILGTRTTNATPVVLRSDTASAGTTNQLILPNNSAYFVEGAVIANVTGAGNTKSWQFTAQIKRGANAASTVLTGSTVTSPYGDAGASAWVVALSADTTNGGLAVTVTGQASTTIRWVCKIETTEVAY